MRETIVVRSDIIIILGYNNNLEAKRGFWGKESVGKYGVQKGYIENVCRICTGSLMCKSLEIRKSLLKCLGVFV